MEKKCKSECGKVQSNVVYSVKLVSPFMTGLKMSLGALVVAGIFYAVPLITFAIIGLIVR